MNKKKIIFLVALWVIVFILLIVAIIASMNTGNKSSGNSKIDKDLSIWILDDSKDDFSIFLEEFKKYSGIKNLNITVESFSNYKEYNKALSSAIIKEQSPDLYMLNNNEKSIFLENAAWIDPLIISPDELRSYFKPFFWDDLITNSEEEWEKIEFLLGVPFWYETLWLYYNFKRVNDVKKLWSFPKIQEVIEDFSENRPWYTALGIWMWTSVEDSQDIITQFIMSSWAKWISSVWGSEINSAFSEYFAYSSEDNKYIDDHEILIKSNRTNLDYFIDWKIAMIFAYPRMLNRIAEAWFSRNFLRVTSFPDFINDSEKLVNYNYFVMSKYSNNKELAYDFLKYLFSEEWQKAYITAFKYYIPARISVYADLKDTNINDDFYIKISNFYNSEAIYSSFNKIVREDYDYEIKKILDDQVSYLQKAGSLFSSLRCVWDKIINLENLSKNCR